jgi:nucleotide-binding universal stress UspA family protein
VSSAADSRLARQPATSASPFRRVLVAWDGSADSVTALRTAAAIVGEGHGHVVALSVLAAAPHREAAKDEAADLSAQVRRLEMTFELTRASIARAGSVRINLQTAESRHVAGSLCDYAAEHGFDLLVIGRHGGGGLIHPKLGHIAESAARGCKIPVLLVSAS